MAPFLLPDPMSALPMMLAEAACRRAGVGTPSPARFLSEGASNTVHLVETDRERVVLKLTRSGATRRLAIEHAFLARTQGEIGPRIHLFEPQGSLCENDLVVEEYIEGEHPFALDEAGARRLGDALRRLHAHSVEDFRERLDAPDWRDYVDTRLRPQLAIAREATPPDLRATLETLLDRVIARGATLEARIVGRPRVLVHTDVIPLNVIDSPVRGMVLIDWEWVRIDLPEWDLASVLKAFALREGAADSFWDAYGNRPDSDILAFVSALHHLNVVLWRACAFHARGEYREHAATFLADLHEELRWLEEHLPGAPVP